MHVVDISENDKVCCALCIPAPGRNGSKRDNFLSVNNNIGGKLCTHFMRENFTRHTIATTLHKLTRVNAQ